MGCGRVLGMKDMEMRGAFGKMIFLCVAAVGAIPAAPALANDPKAIAAPAGEALAPWQPGMLDIHHINTGRGNSAFFVLPDGTTMLFDAGALEDDWAKKHQPLKLAPARPDASLRPGQWIADYIGQFAPPGLKQIEYALISHFHADHFGRVQSASPMSSRGDWKLAGITDVAERWPIATLIDRNFPAYDFPVPLRAGADASLANYFRFVDANVRADRMRVQALAIGRDDQIVLKRRPGAYPGFSVHNVAANGRVSDRVGQGVSAFLDPKVITDAKGKFNENPLSMVIKLSYGAFDYVTGGDLTGVSEPDQPAWFNVESKVAPAIGEADVISLNHHGNRDATNADWLRTLKPRVIVEQTWVSDHPGGEVVARITSKTLWPEPRDIFATHVQDETKIAVGPWLTRNYASTEGHIVVRVAPGGGSYDVYILDDQSVARTVKAHFGPYRSRAD